MSRALPHLAIVGGGPRAAYALESLARHVALGGTAPSLIDIYEPRAVVGTGSAYEGGQPDWVRLNIPLHTVDAGAVMRAGNTFRAPFIDDLATWAGGGDASIDDFFPPRSQAGEYLAHLASTSIRALSPTRVTHRRHEVSSVLPDGTVFTVVHAGGAANYDAVLLATGHAHTWRGGLAAAPDEVRCLPALPVNALMAHAAELRPTHVYVRGASLTAIDAVLALTEGLGGTFDGSGPNSYRPGDRDVRITLVSRTGRLMDAKTESRVLRQYGTAEAIASALMTFGDDSDVGELLVAAATLALNEASHSWSPAPVAVHAAQVEGALSAIAAHTTRDPRDRLRTSLAQARGLAAPDAIWALGQAWRFVYPSLVRRQQRLISQELDAPLGWPDYPRLRSELERLAFGPPPINAEKLIALMDAGRLSVIAARPDGFEALVAGADLVVDAVSAPPGIRNIDDPLWQQLLADGLVTIAPYGRGILVDSAAGCLRSDGAAVPGLSAVGRVTEDVVIGNDTLIRTMHAELELWAQRLCTAQELVS